MLLNSHRHQNELDEKDIARIAARNVYKYVVINYISVIKFSASVCW